ncbi:MAG: TetR/AcrR family transcriptional regulator [Bryobacteraceae bacterium]|nr:TetR/AcrR family transcriptional regulator [Bryobacteraceae bacterium]
MTGQERRQAIIDAAIRLFSEKGFRGTTTRELAAAVGVTEPVLYQHFETKRELFSAILESRLQYTVEAFEEEMRPMAEGEDDRRFFQELARVIVDWYTKDTSLTRLLLFSGLEGYELADLFFDRNKDQFFGLITGYLEKRMKAGAFREMHPGLAARAFAGMVGSYGMDAAVFPKALPPEPRAEVMETMVDIFLAGLRKQ